MRYTKKSPCDSCPYVRSTGFVLTPARVREFEAHVAGGFPCHKTTNVVDGDRDGSKEVHCAGSLILQWRQYGGFDGLVAWVLSRPDGKNVPEGWSPETHLDLDADVFDSFDEMYRTMCERGGHDPDDEDDPRVRYGIEGLDWEDDDDDEW